jgi:hypothetical protein
MCVSVLCWAGSHSNPVYMGVQPADMIMRACHRLQKARLSASVTGCPCHRPCNMCGAHFGFGATGCCRAAQTVLSLTAASVGQQAASMPKMHPK